MEKRRGGKEGNGKERKGRVGGLILKDGDEKGK